jgi:hypothetical protein
MNSIHSGINFLFIFSFSLVAFSSSALAGGGGDIPSSGGAQNLPTPVSGVNSNNSLPTGIQPVSSINSLNNLQNNSFNYSNTQFSSSSSSYQCGLSFGSTVSNANTLIQPVFTIDMRYNTSPCADPKYQAEVDLKRTQVQANSNNIQACIVARRDLAIAGKDPNLACPEVDRSLFGAVR